MEEGRRRAAQIPMAYTHAEAKATATGDGAPAPDSEEAHAALAASAHVPFVRGGMKVGRNNPCPCGSGRKFKQCHGQITQPH